MGRTRITSVAAVVAAAFGIMALAASAASAATWAMPGASVRFAGPDTVLTNTATGISVTCNTSFARGTLASSASSIWTSTSPTFGGGCRVMLGSTQLGTATVTTSGAWSFRANSTTSATVEVPDGGAVVNVVLFSGPRCTITIVDLVTGDPSTVTGVWDNATHSLTLNRAPGINTTTSGAPCPGGPATFDGRYIDTLRNATIVP